MLPHLQKILDLLPGWKQVGDHWMAICPAHNDSTPSLSISIGDANRIIMCCHAKCTNHAILKILGLTFADLFDPDTKQKNISRPKPAEKIVATYRYVNAAGEHMYDVVRFEPKTFKQRKANGEWNMNGVDRVLYRLPEVLASDDAVLIAEGEKDADNLASLGFTATCNPGGAGKFGAISDLSPLQGRDIIIIADKDKPGREHAADVAMKINGRAKSIKCIEMPGEKVKDASDWIAAGGTAEQLKELIAKAGDPPPPLPVKPEPILIGTDEHRVADEVIAALEKDPDLYYRARSLVGVIDEPTIGSISRQPGTTMICNLSQANVRERITKYAEIAKRDSNDELNPKHPPSWLVSAVAERGSYPKLRPLYAISDGPILRPDGSVFQSPGYDRETAVLYAPKGDRVVVTDDPMYEDAFEARDSLLDIVCDYPFESEVHKSAFMAALLTPVGRYAFSGPSPLFLFDANVRGSGKSKLGQIVAEIATGSPGSVMSYSHDVVEMRKAITAAVIAADRVIFLDNIEGSFGNEALDRALTGEFWKDRVLGKSELINFPLVATWLASANNCQVSADTSRRIIHCRIDAMMERPEDRSGFKYPDLIGHVRQNRSRYLSNAITILSAYIKNGKPNTLRPFGSFEGWSSIIRGAVAWIGMPDPCASREGLLAMSDSVGDALESLIMAWSDYDMGGGIIISELMRQLYRGGLSPIEEAMRIAIEGIVGVPPGKIPTSRQVAGKLKSQRRRVKSGKFFDVDHTKNDSRGAVWKLFSVDNSSST